MSESYEGTFRKFESMAGIIIEEGTSGLIENLEAGDWTLFNTLRLVLDEEELTKQDQRLLDELDRQIAQQFTPDLLDEYARFQDKFYKWWGNDT